MATPLFGMAPPLHSRPSVPPIAPPWAPATITQLPALGPGDHLDDGLGCRGPALGLVGYRAERPCPVTAQYFLDASEVRLGLQRALPSRLTDICAWVHVASAPLEANDTSAGDVDLVGLPSGDSRLVFQCISGWALLLWRSEDEFKAGISGGGRSPKPLASWDLRRAYDVVLEAGDPSQCQPSRITLVSATGVYWFCLWAPDGPIWLDALRRLLASASLQSAQTRDTPQRQRRRWPAACGAARALTAANGGLGERALAILFHCYDVDDDCVLRLGELMILLQEILGAAASGAVDIERSTAMFAAESIAVEELCDRALTVRRRCDPAGSGKVRKFDFVQCGLEALQEAMDVDHPVGNIVYTSC